MQLLANSTGKLFWTACFLGWCALVTVTASSISVFQLFPFWIALQMAFILWGPYALATPFVLWVARRFPLSRVSWRPNIWVHILAALLFVGVCESSFAGLVRLLRPQVAAVLEERRKSVEDLQPVPDPLGTLGPSPGKAALRLIVFKMQFSLPLYWVLVGVAHALSAMAALREREKQAAQLAAHLTQAQLAGLRTQLQPHFLFNTLNSIAALIPRNAKLATEMVMNLSDLLRMTLREPQRGEIRLSEELALLQHYVDIQRLRFGERLEFHVEASDEAASAYVPPLLLQPLVENAIRHGLEASDQTERVIVHGRIKGDELHLEVSNTFNASLEESRSSSHSTGVGLANTQARLKVQFGDKQYFEAGPLAEGGFRVTMRIPARSTVLPSLITTHED
jgi:signal transduction histidine kinase